MLCTIADRAGARRTCSAKALTLRCFDSELHSPTLADGLHVPLVIATWAMEASSTRAENRVSRRRISCDVSGASDLRATAPAAVGLEESTSDSRERSLRCSRFVTVELVKRLVAVAAALSTAGSGAAGDAKWRSFAPLPVARTEVAATVVGRDIAIVGGFLADGSSSRRVDLYTPAGDRWRRGPDLPVGLNHAGAATLRGRMVVVGGYASGGATRGSFVLDAGRWTPLPPLPARRAAAGAVALAGKLYVVGGVGPAGLARSAFVFDPRSRRWRVQPGPTPREHLAVAAAGGRIYAIGGRTAGFDTNLALVESWRPGEPRWRAEPAIPEPRGGTGAAAAGGLIVSVGGEAPAGTLSRVYGFDISQRAWRRLPDLPTRRHGLGVAALGRTVYVIGGGPEPGLHVSAANEALKVG
jgi:non-specific serine/threonine protein kinase